MYRTTTLPEGVGYDIAIYTDGSKTGNNAGYGWAATKDDVVIAEEWAPIGNAEVFQVQNARHIRLPHVADLQSLQTKTHPINVVVMSDSRAALESLTAHTTTIFLEEEMQDAATKASEMYNIFFTWVPGHKDVTGNELADRYPSLFISSLPITTLYVEGRCMSLTCVEI